MFYPNNRLVARTELQYCVYILGFLAVYFSELKITGSIDSTLVIRVLSSGRGNFAVTIKLAGGVR